MYDSSVPRSVADQHFNTYALRRHLDFGRLIRVQCAGFIRAEASGEASVRGSSGERTCSGGARPEEGMGGLPGTGEVYSASRATPRNHATRVSTEPARSTPSRMTPAFTRDRGGIACCAPLYVARLTCAPPMAATIMVSWRRLRLAAATTAAATATATGDDGSNGGSYCCSDGGSDRWRQWQGWR